MFSIGRKGVIQLRDNSGAKLQFVIRSYFRIRWKRKLELYKEIVDHLFLRFFDQLTEECLKGIYQGEKVIFSEFIIGQNAIARMNSRNEIVQEILFKEALLKETPDQLIISSKVNKKSLISIHDEWVWNASILQYIIKQLCPSSN